MKSTQLEITENMQKYKDRIPHYREGGYRWKDAAYIGVLIIINMIKFNRTNDLEEMLKDIDECDLLRY
ncbi:MAG: hypothetical protein GY861_12855 [bacterium]|nr:hypothetical protein [bacterium]